MKFLKPNISALKVASLVHVPLKICQSNDVIVIVEVKLYAFNANVLNFK